jgi:hypothetical protein
MSAQTQPPAAGPKKIVGYPNELERVKRRRSDLDVPRVKRSGRPLTWALALSGGGIRSATLSLGAIQAMARARLSGTPSASDPSLSLLRQFDYLSTVSGGGYMGSFFCSLFVRGRRSNDPNESARTAADAAYRVMEYEPPGRLHFSDKSSPADDSGKAPLAWLRDNGRYLSPTGAGDTLYGAVLAARNWASIQYVLGTVLLLLFATIALTDLGLAHELGDHQKGLLSHPLWLLPIGVAALAVVPLGIAFWLAHVPHGKTDQDIARFSRAAISALLLGAAFVAVGYGLHWLKRSQSAWEPLTTAAFVIGILVLLACGWFVVGLLVKEDSNIAYQRVLLTRWLKDAVFLAVLASALISVDSAGAWLYTSLSSGHVWPVSASALLAAAVWLVRHVAHLLDETKKPGSPRIPLGLLAAVAGGLLLFAVAAVWALAVQSVRWLGQTPCETAALLACGVPVLYQAEALAGLWAVALALTVVTGMFPGFVNLSTFQSLYGARITRAYLGASNGKRFVSGSEGTAARSVAEPIEGDQISHADYYGGKPGDVLAPLHIINITMNQTVDPTEQLVQRDRKGKPLAVLPEGFSIEDDRYEFASPDSRRGGIPMSIGQWIGTSGAAFTTGLGRTTSLGFSFLLGMANVRLGTWWRSGCGIHEAAEKLEGLLNAFRATFPTQQLLLDELSARFYGLRRPWQYLSDGGHFENMALYELLRADRHVDLVVVCDNGRDSDYQFADLANLIRLARIDFRLEIEVDTAVTQQDSLKGVFGTPADFAKETAGACAMLLNVRKAESGTGDPPVTRIILLKPRLVDALPIDVLQYANTHLDFPQETTADQFFNEAQWESYRKLGLTIGRRVFEGEAGAALWKYLQLELPRA